MILDSDIIIDFLRRESYAIEKIKKLREREINLLTTSINTFELFRGFVTSKKYSIEILYNLLDNLKILNFNVESSKKAAEIFEYLKSNGELVDLADVMIAATVIVNNETLLTKNIKHFKRIPELIIEEI